VRVLFGSSSSDGRFTHMGSQVPSAKSRSCQGHFTHERLRARDHYASSTLIGGEGGAGPSSLHATLEGPTEYVNARWMESLCGFLHGI
jgi:hypothetical protein